MKLLPWSDDARRTLRAIVQAVVLLVLLALLWALSDRLLPADLPVIVKWLIAVIAISVAGNQIENGVRSIKIGPSGIDAEGNGNPPPPAPPTA